MKTNLFFAFVFLFFTFSCSKNEPSKDLTDNINPQMIGTYHNILLAEMMKTHSLSEIKGKSISEVMEMANKVAPKVFDNNFKYSSGDFDKIQISRSKFDSKLKSTNEQLPTVKEISIILKTNGKISEEAYSDLLQVNQMIENNDRNVIAFVENLKIKNESDRLIIETFKSVFKSSNEYWSDPKSKIGYTKRGDMWNAAVMGADAGGALYGMLCGPICSILEGAAFSFIAEANR